MNVLDDLALLRPGWLDLFEILLVAVILYRVFLLVQQTRAMQILLGLFVLGGTYLVAQLFGLDLIRYLLETVFQYGVILALVVFQPELRSALARIGQSRMVRIFSSLEESQVADEIADAVERLSRSKIGAIIAVEQEVGLDEYADTGSAVDARVSADMLTTIFTPYSPLHDGAVLIRGDQ
ncbi:MAG TPA: diadenylate cyclase, partial [Longimicrobiales bacterium]|nr:diadenylate cyclase [Longimicrobiales bacterium]